MRMVNLCTNREHVGCFPDVFNNQKGQTVIFSEPRVGRSSSEVKLMPPVLHNNRRRSRNAKEVSGLAAPKLPGPRARRFSCNYSVHTNNVGVMRPLPLQGPLCRVAAKRCRSPL